MRKLNKKIWKRYDRLREPWRFLVAFVIAGVGVGALVIQFLPVQIFGSVYILGLLLSRSYTMR